MPECSLSTIYFYLSISLCNWPFSPSGTGSARAALVNDSGEILAESTYATTTYRDERDANIFEQSTTESESTSCPGT